MYIELDEYYDGLAKFLVRKWSQSYIAMGMCILFLYLIDHWLFKELVIGMLLMPVATPLIGLPLVWLLDIKPVTDKESDL